MMKRFLTAMLGSIAGFWISLIILGVTFIVFIIVAAASGSGTSVLLDNNSVLHLKLSGDIQEREKPIKTIYDLQSYNEDAVTYNDILFALEEAKNDDNIKGIFIECIGSTLGVASYHEIHDAINDFKKSGKWVYAYGDNYTLGDYYIASVSDSLFLNPVGNAQIMGLSATTIFYKGLMDKIGIEAQIIKVGTYKSAVEPFILTEMSDASREQQEKYIGNIWSEISSQIAKSRNVSVEDVNMWADSLIFTTSGEKHIEYKIADKLSYRHEVEDMMHKSLGLDSSEKINYVGVRDYCSIKRSVIDDVANDHIAILYATGDIVDSGDGGIVGTEIVPQIIDLAKDEKVKGLILRVNSGGGSALASEQIWEALEQFKKTGKPFYVSMGDFAASGGYYISCGADKIFAKQTTLTGSIGIFAIIPNAKDFLNNKLGIYTGEVSSNAHGNFPSFISPMTDSQKENLQKYVERGYEIFVKRCADGRKMSVDDIKKIAEGRVWDGISAKEIGLIDEFGGLQEAIAQMKKETGLSDIKEYPIYSMSIFNQILESGQLSEVKILPAEVGEFKEYFHLINRIKRMSTIQCKMEDIIIK